MEKKRINIFKSKYFMPSLFIIVISILISIPSFFKAFSVQFDDGIQHICRLIGTEQSIYDEQAFPVIMQNLCNNFGYSWNLFYSPVTAYMPLIFRIFGFSFTMCLKLFMLAISIATGFSMYFFLRKILRENTEEKKANLIAILGAAFYIMVPYRLNDMYLRVAIAELASFAFIPIVFNGLYSVVNLKEQPYLLIFGASMMLLTHSLLTVYLVMFCAIYLAVNIKKVLDKKTIFNLILSAILILLLTSFYWVPLLESKLASDYVVFHQEHMVRENAMINLKATILELFVTLPNRHMYGLGILVIIGTILSFFCIQKVKDKKNYILFLVLGIISTIMSLNFFPFEKLPSFFRMMQFSFRMLEFASFFLVVVASIGIGECLNKFSINTVLVLSIISLLLVSVNLNIFRTGEFYSEEDLIKGIPVTENTLRIHAGCASFEYLPSNALNNRKYIEDRQDAPIILDEGNGNITNYSKNGTSLSFDIESKENITIELPYIYYIGYTVKLEDEYGNIKVANTFESDNGFVAVKTPYAKAKVTVKYTGTALMKITYLTSFLTFVGLIAYVILKKNSRQ